MDEEPNRKESESGEKGSSDASNDDNDSAASGESVREGEATNSDSQMPSDQLRPSASDGDGGKQNESETVEISDDISSEFAKPLPPQAPPAPASDAHNSAELYGNGCDSDRNDDSGKSGDSDRNESENEGMSDAGSNSSSGSHKTKKSNRCQVCRKKVGLTGFMCRCGGLFCSVHRYSDKHSCTFNYRELGAEEIRKNNPVVLGEKIHKI